MNYAHSHQRAIDAGQQAAALHDWDQQYEQLSAGRFEGVVEELRLGPVQVFAERANQTVMQAGRVRKDRISLALAQPGAVSGWFCGHKLVGEQLIGVSAQADFDLVAGAGMGLLAISVDTRALLDLMASLSGPGHEAVLSVPSVLAPTPGALAAYKQLLNSALALARAPSTASPPPAAQRMLALSLSEAVLGCLPATPCPAELPASAASRRRTVARARQYMQAHAHEVIAVPELCQAIGSSRRALQYAFEEVMQISPVTYLRTLRLNQVRRELRERPELPLGELAARWGFWHPSRFAADYKALFGELPSATRAANASTW